MKLFFVLFFLSQYQNAAAPSYDLSTRDGINHVFDHALILLNSPTRQYDMEMHIDGVTFTFKKREITAPGIYVFIYPSYCGLLDYNGFKAEILDSRIVKANDREYKVIIVEVYNEILNRGSKSDHESITSLSEAIKELDAILESGDQCPPIEQELIPELGEPVSWGDIDFTKFIYSHVESGCYEEPEIYHDCATEYKLCSFPNYWEAKQKGFRKPDHDGASVE